MEAGVSDVSYDPQKYTLSVYFKKEQQGEIKVAWCMCILCVLPHGTGITGITMYLGTPTTPAALVRLPNTNLQQHRLPKTHPFKCAALIAVSCVHFF